VRPIGSETQLKTVPKGREEGPTRNTPERCGLGVQTWKGGNLQATSGAHLCSQGWGASGNRIGGGMSERGGKRQRGNCGKHPSLGKTKVSTNNRGGDKKEIIAEKKTG